MIVPIVHLNGTSSRALLEMRSEAWESLEAARDAIKQMAPNGRDYYVGEPGLLEKAIEQHRRRLGALDKLQADIKEEMDAILDQQEGRVRR